ncbi:MAG: 3-oxoacyl-[acyl-carrier-protein] reductase [Candidatus Margulisiibacteriota bacterium]
MVQDKVAVVTGSSRGIGFTIADTLAASGAKLVVSATTQEGAQKAADKLKAAHGVEVLAVKADVSKAEDAQALIKAAMDTFGRVDILVNNAGITRDNLLLRMSDQDWDDVIRVNLGSVFHTVKAVSRPMLKQRFGRIINITSVVGVMGNPGQANYAAAKAGMIGFTKTVAKEFGAKGITCNAVAPGFIETDMIESLPKEYLDTIMALVPVKRLGTSQEVAQLVLFLASETSSYITGQVINIDGGLHM